MSKENFVQPLETAILSAKVDCESGKIVSQNPVLNGVDLSSVDFRDLKLEQREVAIVVLPQLMPGKEITVVMKSIQEKIWNVVLSVSNTQPFSSTLAFSSPESALIKHKKKGDVAEGGLDEKKEYTEMMRFMKTVVEIFNAIPVPISVVYREDDGYRYEIANGAYLKLMKRSLDQVQNRPVYEVWGQEIFDNYIQKHFEEVYKGAEVDINYGVDLKKTPGRKKHFSAKMSPIYGENDDVNFIVSVVQDRTVEKEAEIKIQELNFEKIKTLEEIILKLGEVIETSLQEDKHHVRRVSEFSRIIAQHSGLSDEDTDNIGRAAPMHDLGKIGIPDAILLKPGKLTPEEFSLIETHSMIGAKILGKSDDEIVKLASIIALQHHEKWNGKGYPEGLKGEEIDLSARIVAIADVFDALTSKRPYKDPWTVEKAVKVINADSGIHFDPKLVEAFNNGLEEILIVKQQFSEEND